MKQNDYMNRSAVMLIAERHFMLAIFRASQALGMADYYDCISTAVEADSPEAINSFYQSLADSHIRTAKNIVDHLYKEDEISLDDVRTIYHWLVWFNYPEVETDA